MKLSIHQQIFSQHVGRFILYANGMGVNLTFGEANRPQSLQYLYFYGYTIKVINGALKLIKAKKRSKTLYSDHSKRLAIDFNFFIGGKLYRKHPMINALAKYWIGLDPEHNYWGGNFKSFYDGPHFGRKIC